VQIIDSFNLDVTIAEVMEHILNTVYSMEEGARARAAEAP